MHTFLYMHNNGVREIITLDSFNIMLVYNERSIIGIPGILMVLYREHLALHKLSGI